MDKKSLLERLEHAREGVATANFESVIQARLVTQLATEGRETMSAQVELASWKMEEQKHLREMDWILDRLEEIER